MYIPSMRKAHPKQIINLSNDPLPAEATRRKMNSTKSTFTRQEQESVTKLTKKSVLYTMACNRLFFTNKNNKYAYFTNITFLLLSYSDGFIPFNPFLPAIGSTERQQKNPAQLDTGFR